MARPYLFEDAPFAECHAGSLTRAGAGWLCVWFAGSHERNPDVGIWAADGDGQSWSAPRRIAKVTGEAHWNPVVFRAPDDRLHLWFKVGESVPVWRTYTQVSDDDGRSWGAARELVPGDIGGRGPVKNKPLLLSDGAWLAGASIEAPRGDTEDWDLFVDRTEDDGLTWQASPWIARDSAVIGGLGAIQPTLWESAPGKVHLLARTTCRRIARSDSDDGGRTWSPLALTDLPHNNSGIDLVLLDSGVLALVCNPIEGTWPDRSPLSLLLSDDNGETWRHARDLETEPGAEFSYPAIVADGPDAVAVLYTWKRRRMAFQRISLAAS